eukprot:6311577-Pyramimonas_sp.AAC.1
MGHNAQEGEPPTVGTWLAEDTVHLWDKLPNHRDSWPLFFVFAGRVPTRFSHRICQGVTLVSREVPRFTDIDKAVTLVRVGNPADIGTQQMSVVFNHEWASYEVTFDNESVIAWIRTDETLSLVPNHRPQLPPEAQERV